jgi:hypothetical protein
LAAPLRAILSRLTNLTLLSDQPEKAHLHEAFNSVQTLVTSVSKAAKDTNISCCCLTDDALTAGGALAPLLAGLTQSAD